MIVEKCVTKKEELEIIGANLLSIEEAESLPEGLRKYKNWWWLRSPGDYLFHAAYVDLVGSVNCGGSYAYHARGCVRPALVVNLNSNFNIGDCFIFGGKEFEIVSDTLAFCKSDIGEHSFDEKSNNYETSEIKTYVEDWFNEVVIKGE